MYELVLVENGIKKAGKVIIIFLENPFLIIFNENSRPGGGMARTLSVWASTWTVSLKVSNSLRIFLIICVLEHLAAFELIDKAQGNDGVWSWEKVSLLIFFENLLTLLDGRSTTLRVPYVISESSF